VRGPKTGGRIQKLSWEKQLDKLSHGNKPHRGMPMPLILIQLSNSQSSAVRFAWGAGCPSSISALPKNEGEQSADRRWCGTPHPVTRLAVGSISGSPEITGP